MIIVCYLILNQTSTRRVVIISRTISYPASCWVMGEYFTLPKFAGPGLSIAEPSRRSGDLAGKIHYLELLTLH